MCAPAALRVCRNGVMSCRLCADYKRPGIILQKKLEAAWNRIPKGPTRGISKRHAAAAARCRHCSALVRHVTNRHFPTAFKCSSGLSLPAFSDHLVKHARSLRRQRAAKFRRLSARSRTKSRVQRRDPEAALYRHASIQSGEARRTSGASPAVGSWRRRCRQCCPSSAHLPALYHRQRPVLQRRRHRDGSPQRHVFIRDCWGRHCRV